MLAWKLITTLDVIFFSAARTTPSLAKMPTAAPALDMASIAYSTWYSLPSGLKMVVRESYLLDMLYCLYQASQLCKMLLLQASPKRSLPGLPDLVGVENRGSSLIQKVLEFAGCA